MTSFTNYTEEKSIKHLLGKGEPGTVFTPPAELYLSLHTADPGEEPGVGSEVSAVGTGYDRVPVTFDFEQRADGRWQGKNSEVVLFAAALAPWGIVRYVAVSDALTAGDRLVRAPLADPNDDFVTLTPVDVKAGDALRFDPGTLMVALD